VAKEKVVEIRGEEKVYLPLCRRVAGEVVCVEKGIEVVYGGGSNPILKSIRVKYPKVEGNEGGGELIRRTLIYKRGVVGPIEILMHYDGE